MDIGKERWSFRNFRKLSWNKNQKWIGCLQYLTQYKNLALMAFNSFMYYVKKQLIFFSVTQTTRLWERKQEYMTSESKSDSEESDAESEQVSQIRQLIFLKFSPYSWIKVICDKSLCLIRPKRDGPVNIKLC